MSSMLCICLSRKALSLTSRVGVDSFSIHCLCLRRKASSLRCRLFVHPLFLPSPPALSLPSRVVVDSSSLCRRRQSNLLWRVGLLSISRALCSAALLAACLLSSSSMVFSGMHHPATRPASSPTSPSAPPSTSCVTIRPPSPSPPLSVSASRFSTRNSCLQETGQHLTNQSTASTQTLLAFAFNQRRAYSMDGPLV